MSTKTRKQELFILHYQVHSLKEAKLNEYNSLETSSNHHCTLFMSKRSNNINSVRVRPLFSEADTDCWL